MALVASVATVSTASAYPVTGWLGWDGCVRAAELFESQCYNYSQWGIERPQAVAPGPDGISLYVAADGLNPSNPYGRPTIPGGLAVYRRDPTNGPILWNGCLRDASVACNGCYNLNDTASGERLLEF